MPLQHGDGNLVRSARRLDTDLWFKGINSLLGMELPNMQVECPKCGKTGVPGPKWVRGPKIKPLFVFHRNGGDRPDLCALDSHEAKAIREQVNLFEEDLRVLLRNGRAYVLFSGGLDSLCTLAYVASFASSTGQEVTALHASTTAGFPEVTQYVRATCSQLKVELEVVQPRVDYFTMARQWGIPGINRRWCCRELKIRPIMDFLASVNEPKIIFDGIRAVESSIRAQYLPVWFHPSFNCLSISAIFRWSNEDVRVYIRERNLPVADSSRIGTSVECWCGAYKKKEDFKELYRLNRDMFIKLKEVEEGNKSGFTFIYEGGKRLSLRQLERQMEEGAAQE